VALTNHPHLAPRLKKEYSYTFNPPLGLRGLLQSELTLYILPHRSVTRLLFGRPGDRGSLDESPETRVLSGARPHRLGSTQSTKVLNLTIHLHLVLRLRTSRATNYFLTHLRGAVLHSTHEGEVKLKVPCPDHEGINGE